ncbi:hypothetical protein T07_6057 [Trichinella nelsoni]|uniref:Uncharacterized protein n=1 Tax=Trichinella nelsoni TaxID=6336 RepID=A0A0V0RNN3_9BILA|nr:hypothetical protein T07_6057 [Trichinella nelsoni]
MKTMSHASCMWNVFFHKEMINPATNILSMKNVKAVQKIQPMTMILLLLNVIEILKIKGITLTHESIALLPLG